MKRHAAVAMFLFVAVDPILGQVAQGWMVRVDRSTTASDPDAPGHIKLVRMGSGFRAIAPQAAVFWNPANTAMGNYTLKGTFTLIKSTGYLEYYGLIFGGSNLDAAGQQYLYFVITDDGTWLIKRRTGATTQELADRTANAARKKPYLNGTRTNSLELRVMGVTMD